MRMTYTIQTYFQVLGNNVLRMVMSGESANPSSVVSACENFWNGIVKWATEHNYSIHSKRFPF
ncbi:kanamycin nucleotidyltransferase C-terminal domain-containing protein [Paenibacillus lautus]|uniref:kanamycin nucleotidyltransferase C-terminal domain-containing protein n=1 Tax=Paenibacillus lautus TaxID=1401 RepID=UPI003D2753B6